MEHPPRMTLSGIVLDAPEARDLAAFYRRLLGWIVGQDEPDWSEARPTGRWRGAVLLERAGFAPAGVAGGPG